MHFEFIGLPVLSQKPIVKHYIILSYPKPNCQLSFGILSQMAFTVMLLAGADWLFTSFF